MFWTLLSTLLYFALQSKLVLVSSMQLIEWEDHIKFNFYTALGLLVLYLTADRWIVHAPEPRDPLAHAQEEWQEQIDREEELSGWKYEHGPRHPVAAKEQVSLFQFPA